MNQQEEFDKINEYIDQMLAIIANLRIENQKLCEESKQLKKKLNHANLVNNTRCRFSGD